MRIHADKIEEGPPHALDARDVRLILRTVPPSWTELIREVRISNSLEFQNTFFARYDGCLTIYSRHRTKEQALRDVLCELAAVYVRLDRGLRYRPKGIRSRLQKMTAPYVEQLLPLIAPPHSKGHISLEGFKEVRFPLVPNDSE